MNKSTIDDAKAVFQLAMIAAYKGEAVSKAVAQSLGMPFDETKVQKVASALVLEREQAEDALFEEWKSRRNPLIAPVIQSFKAFASALGQRVALEVAEIMTTVFQPPNLSRPGVATRENKFRDAEQTETPPELHTWRLWLIEEERDPVRLSLQTDFPTTGDVEFVVLGLNADVFEDIANASRDEKQVASDAIRVLWSGTVQTDESDNEAEISFAMPKDLRIVDMDSHYKVLLQQDAQGVWGVILKVEHCAS